MLHKLDFIPAGPRVSTYRILVPEIVYCLVSPILAVLLFHIGIINQYGYVDPEFYTGYGYSFARMWHVYGPTYYAMRFPIMALNSFFQHLGPGLFGYTLLRLLLLWACGIPLYFSVRRLYGSWVGVVAYACLLLNPFFARLLLWDLTIFVSIPTALAGMAVWHLRAQRSLLTAAISGFLFCVSVNSHIFTGTAIGLFLLTELIFALATAWERRRLLVDVAGLALGSLVCMGLGLAFYGLHVGYVSPLTMLHVTLAATKAYGGDQFVQSHNMPFSSYFATNYDIYVPFISTALAAVTLRTSLLRNTVQARITWFAILYCAAYLFAVFIRHMFIAQTFYYLLHLTIVVYLTVPIILGETVGIPTWLRLLSYCIGLVIPLVIARIDGSFIVHLDAAALGVTQVVVAIGIATCFIAVILVYGRRAPIAGTTAFWLLGLLVQIPFLVPVYSYMYIDNPNRSAEAPLYGMIRQYHLLLQERDQPGQRVLTWYATDHRSFTSLASSNLLLTLHNPWVVPGGMPTLGQYERDRLANGQYKYVLLIDSDRALVDRGLDALAEAGVRVEILEEHVWGEPPLTAYALLVQLMRTGGTAMSFAPNVMVDTPPPEFTFVMPEALPLGAIALAYDKASITGTAPVRIQTAPQQWAYAAAIPILLDRTLQAKRLVHIRGRVWQGQIGIGILHRKTNTFQVEKFLNPTPTAVDYYIPIPTPEAADDLIIRNTSSSGVPSEMTVDATEILAPAQKIEPWARLSDIELADDKAAIERGTLITVTTAAEQWAYAAAIPLHPAGEAQGVMLKLRMLVTRGEIGVGILASDQKQFITERRYGPAAEPIDVLLPMPSPAEGCRLIIRTTAPNARVSQVVLESIETWKLD